MSPKGIVCAISILGALSGSASACAAAGQKEPGQGRAEVRKIETALKRHNDRLLALPGVVGTAVGQRDGKMCIKVFVVKKTPDLLARLPSTLEGFPVIVEETGEIRALDRK